MSSLPTVQIPQDRDLGCLPIFAFFFLYIAVPKEERATSEIVSTVCLVSREEYLGECGLQV